MPTNRQIRLPVVARCRFTRCTPCMVVTGEPLSRTPFRHAHRASARERCGIVAGGPNLLKGNPVPKNAVLPRITKFHRQCLFPVCPPYNDRHGLTGLVLAEGAVKVLQTGNRTVAEPNNDIPTLETTGGSWRVF